MSEKTGEFYRLPTEAEWEYAARSGGREDQKYAETNNVDELELYAWFNKNIEEQIHQVGKKKPNHLKLYDMSGNVGEWCLDYYGIEYYKNSPKNNSSGPFPGDGRVFRGFFPIDISSLRCSFRFDWDPNIGWNFIGFRLCREVEL